MAKKLFTALVATLLPLFGWAQAGTGLVVNTQSGIIKGIEQEGTLAFLGVPYAKIEHFMPPQPVDR